MKDAPGVIHDSLCAILRFFMKQEIEEGGGNAGAAKEFYMDRIRRVGASRFRVGIERELAELNGIFRNSDNRDDFSFDSREKIKETITFKDFTLDFSGKEIVFRKGRADEFRRKSLPYTMEDFKSAAHTKFDEYMAGNFEDDRTREMALYYISLIPSLVQYKYGAFFIGEKNTGKSTFVKLLETIYGGLIGVLPESVLAPKGKTFSEGNGPTPYIAALYGLGAAVVSEISRDAWLNEPLFKKLTGYDKIAARGLNESPLEFVNTAQIIMQVNDMPRFNYHDAAILERMIIIPFLIPHERDDKNQKRPDNIIEELRPEFPAIIRLLAEYYIKLKYEKEGKIPISQEAERYKKKYISNQENDVDEFIRNRVIFEKGAIEKIANVYENYLSYFGFSEAAMKRGEGLSRAAFTRFLKRNCKAVEKVVYLKQEDKKDQRCFIGLRLKTPEETLIEAYADGGTEKEKPDNPLEKEENPFE